LPFSVKEYSTVGGTVANAFLTPTPQLAPAGRDMPSRPLSIRIFTALVGVVTNKFLYEQALTIKNSGQTISKILAAVSLLELVGDNTNKGTK